VIDVAGSAAERGAALGVRLRDRIIDNAERWKADLHTRLGVEPEGFAGRFLAATSYLDAINAYTPEILVEVEAMAEAADADHDEILVMQFMDEVWLNAAATAPEHCSSVGAVAGDRVVIAQNMDLETFRDGTQIIVRHRPDGGPDLLLLTAPGVIAFNGLNGAGVGVCVNALGTLASRRHGLPVAFVIRGLLEHANRRDAVGWLDGIPHASGQNYLVGGPDGISDRECSADGVAAMADQRLVLHTNHPLATAATQAGADAVADLGTSSGARLESLRRNLADRDVVGVDDIKAALSATDDPAFPVCRRPEDGPFFTFASTVMETAPSPVMHVALGPPTRCPYETVRF
jgi:isopenicillin-N N-acyltransferase like protein